MDYLAAITNFHLKFKFDPTVFHGEVFNYATRIFVEFNHLYHWHQLVPDEFVVDGKDFVGHSYFWFIIKRSVKQFTARIGGQNNVLTCLF